VTSLLRSLPLPRCGWRRYAEVPPVETSLRVVAEAAIASRGPTRRALWRHWDRCTIHWFAGGHVAAQWNSTIARFVDASRRAILA